MGEFGLAAACAYIGLMNGRLFLIEDFVLLGACVFTTLLLTITAVLVIGKLLGPLGLVVALPILVTVMVIVRRILINRIYEGKGFRKSTRDRIFVLRVPVPDGGVLVPATPPPDLIAIREKPSFKKSA